MNQNDGLKLTTITDRIGDEESARRLFESIRWPEGPACPHCGEIEQSQRFRADAKATRMEAAHAARTKTSFGIDSRKYRAQTRLFPQ